MHVVDVKTKKLYDKVESVDKRSKYEDASVEIYRHLHPYLPFNFVSAASF